MAPEEARKTPSRGASGLMAAKWDTGVLFEAEREGLKSSRGFAVDLSGGRGAGD